MATPNGTSRKEKKKKEDSNIIDAVEHFLGFNLFFDKRDLEASEMLN